MQWKWRANKLRFDASFLDEKSTSFCFLDGDLCNRKRDAITCCQAYNISYLACMTNTWHSKDSFSTFSRLRCRYTFIFVFGHQTVQSCAYSRAAAFAAVYHQSCSARNQVHSTARKGFLAIITFHYKRLNLDAEFGGVRFNQWHSRLDWEQQWWIVINWWQACFLKWRQGEKKQVSNI